MISAQRMIRINLLPVTEQAESRVRMPSMPGMAPLAVAGALMAGVVLVATLQSIRIRSLNHQITSLQAEARQLAPLIQRIDQITRQRELAMRRLTVIEKLDQERLVRVRLVDELARRMPDYVWFTSFTEQKGAIALSGVAFSNLTVAELIRSLERSVLFEQVDLVVSQRGEIDGRSVVNFSLSGRRQTEPDAVEIEPAAHPIGVAEPDVPAPDVPAPGQASRAQAAPGRAARAQAAKSRKS
jgi:type IV pilus assembly protein PilN